MSWSNECHCQALGVINCHEKDVIATNNHLESFNNTLKNQELDKQKHNGHCLWFDYLTDALVMDVLLELRLSEWGNLLDWFIQVMLQCIYTR